MIGEIGAHGEVVIIRLGAALKVATAGHVVGIDGQAMAALRMLAALLSRKPTRSNLGITSWMK
jgi:hypothetical protein